MLEVLYIGFDNRVVRRKFQHPVSLQSYQRDAPPVPALRLFSPFQPSHIGAVASKTLARACQPEGRKADVCLHRSLVRVRLFRIQEGFFCRQTCSSLSPRPTRREHQILKNREICHTYQKLASIRKTPSKPAPRPKHPSLNNPIRVHSCSFVAQCFSPNPLGSHTKKCHLSKIGFDPQKRPPSQRPAQSTHPS